MTSTKKLTERQVEFLYAHLDAKTRTSVRDELSESEYEARLRRLTVNPKRGVVLRNISEHKERRELERELKETWEL